MDISEALIRAIESSHLTRHELADATEVDQAVIWRFINGQRDVRLGTAAKLAKELGLELQPRKRRNSRGAARKT